MRLASRVAAFVCLLCLMAIAGSAQKAPKKNSKQTKTAADTKAAQPADSSTPPAATAAPEYVIGSEDVLTITVIANNSSSYPCNVRPDGYCSVPLIGDVIASGLTPPKLADVIRQKLIDGKIYVDPNVTVTVNAVNSRKAFISGEGIGKSGPIPLVVPTKVSEAIAYMGGFRDFAKRTKVRIVRGTKTFLYNDKQVSKGQHLEQDILLQPGDHIYVDG